MKKQTITFEVWCERVTNVVGLQGRMLVPGARKSLDLILNSDEAREAWEKGMSPIIFANRVDLDS